MIFPRLKICRLEPFALQCMTIAHAVQAVEVDTKLQTDAAVSAEKFEEAGTLQAEHDTVTAEANALASAHGFTDADLGDALLSLPAAPAASSPGTATAAASKHGGDHGQGTGSQQFGGKLTEGRNAIAEQTPLSDGGEVIGEQHQGDDNQQAAPGVPARMHAASSGRAEAGARSASHVATEGSDSGYSVSLEASDGNLSSDADGRVPLAGPWTPPGQPTAVSDEPVAALQRPQTHVQVCNASCCESHYRRIHFFSGIDMSCHGCGPVRLLAEEKD